MDEREAARERLGALIEDFRQLEARGNLADHAEATARTWIERFGLEKVQPPIRRDRALPQEYCGQRGIHLTQPSTISCLLTLRQHRIAM